MNSEEIEMLKVLKEQAIESYDNRVYVDVKFDSFNFVIDQAIKALERDNRKKVLKWQAKIL